MVMLDHDVQEVAPIGAFGFMVQWSVDPCRHSFAVFEIVTGEVHLADGTVDKRPQYHRKGAVDSMDLTYDINDAERYCGGTIKFDGCSEVTFEDHLHLCGRGCWQDHVDLMKWLWNRAATLFVDNPCADEFAPIE